MSNADPIWRLKRIAIGSVALSGISAILSGLALLFATGIIHVGEVGFECRVHAYLLTNPEVIVEAVRQMTEREKAAEENEMTAILTQRHDEIFNDPTSPVGMNPHGDAILVEFFDYNCPYCRKASPMLDELQQADKGLRLVFKEFPILGPGSTFAARAALASQKQGKYLVLHKAMMTYKGSITEASALELAA